MCEPVREPDPLDLLIDSAIAGYAGPPTGLEQRVLKVLQTERLAGSPTSSPLKFPRRRVLPWALALSAAACLMLVLFLHIHGTRRPAVAGNTAPPQTQRSSSPVAVVTGVRTRTAHGRAPKRQFSHIAPGATVAALPKLEVFPTPLPLTSQEQALVEFAIRGPELERKALADTQKKIDPPLSIAAIHIPPLSLPDHGTR